MVKIVYSGGSSVLRKDLDVYFKTIDMQKAKLLYQESEKHPGEVACLMSFVPTFIEKDQTFSPD